ncbi:AAA family ATPase [Spirosoma endbachense]|uniref:AAA family ATPase n=1 Tax=Spirosoma endbachense TaxID=2666025 RepID=A0A6P1W020_9BACT|nr:AAA family ATPase [Spirosoma endbachense]QHV98733.1 AAA family ATPase [Spirosoma endbachense]
MNSFRIIIRLNKLYGNKNVKVTKELEGYIQDLIDCSALSSIKMDSKRGNEYILDFIINEATKSLFSKKFDSSPQNLFEALNKLNLLNTLCIQKTYRNILRKKRAKGQLLKFPQIASLDKIFSIEQIELVLTEPKVRTEYEKISDGEHQFMHILGGIMLFDEKEPMRDLIYLLDEPDTHFNPFWRSTFFYQLQSILENRDIEFILTTHSPFILSDCHGYNVFKFAKKDSHVTFERVKKETYGTTFKNILDDIFQADNKDNDHFKSQIAKMSFLDIEAVYNDIESVNSLKDWLSLSEDFQKRIKMLGDSTDKTYLIKIYTDKEQKLRLQNV